MAFAYALNLTIAGKPVNEFFKHIKIEVLVRLCSIIGIYVLWLC